MADTQIRILLKPHFIYIYIYIYTNRPSVNSNKISELYLAHRNRILLKSFSRVDVLESFSSRRRCVKRLRSEPRQRQFWVRSARTSFWWNNVHAGLAIVFDVHVGYNIIQNAAKSYRLLGLCACLLASWLNVNRSSVGIGKSQWDTHHTEFALTPISSMGFLRISFSVVVA